MIQQAAPIRRHKPIAGPQSQTIYRAIIGHEYSVDERLKERQLPPMRLNMTDLTGRVLNRLEAAAASLTEQVTFPLRRAVNRAMNRPRAGSENVLDVRPL